MSHATRTALAVAALLGTTPAIASAAPWDDARPLRSGGPSALARSPVVTLNDAGLGVAVSAVGGSDAPGPHTDGAAFTNGVFLDPQTFVGGTTRIGAARAYGRTGLLTAGVKAFTGRSQAVLATGSLTPNRARIGTVRPVGPSTLHAADPVLAVNARGDAAMVFAVCRDGGCVRSLVYLVTRRAGTGTLTTTRVGEATRTLPRVATAVNARGDAVAVWTDRTDVRARVRTLGGTLRAARRAGGTRQGSLAPPAAALSPRRGVLVGWAATVVNEGGASSGSVRVAQARDGGTFTGALLQTAPAGDATDAPQVRVAFDDGGVRRLAWSAGGRTHSALLRGSANGYIPGGVVARREVAADGVLDDQEVLGARELLVLRRADGTVVAAERTGTESFATTAIGADATRADAVLTAGRALVVWGTAGPDGARYAQRVIDQPAG